MVCMFNLDLVNSIFNAENIPFINGDNDITYFDGYFCIIGTIDDTDDALLLCDCEDDQLLLLNYRYFNNYIIYEKINYCTNVCHLKPDDLLFRFVK